MPIADLPHNSQTMPDIFAPFGGGFSSTTAQIGTGAVDYQHLATPSSCSSFQNPGAPMSAAEFPKQGCIVEGACGGSSNDDRSCADERQLLCGTKPMGEGIVGDFCSDTSGDEEDPMITAAVPLPGRAAEGEDVLMGGCRETEKNAPRRAEDASGGAIMGPELTEEDGPSTISDVDDDQDTDEIDSHEELRQILAREVDHAAQEEDREDEDDAMERVAASPPSRGGELLDGESFLKPPCVKSGEQFLVSSEEEWGDALALANTQIVDDEMAHVVSKPQEAQNTRQEYTSVQDQARHNLEAVAAKERTAGQKHTRRRGQPGRGKQKARRQAKNARQRGKGDFSG